MVKSIHDKRRFYWAPYLALVPAALIAAFMYVGTMAWTIWISFTSSKMLPVNNFVGFYQYQRLFGDERWQISASNLVVYGVLFIAGSLVLGLLLAIALDQRVRAESSLRTIFLYPQGMSFIVTGLVWQWIMNPELGLQNVAHQLGWRSAQLDWIVRPQLAIYVLVIAGVWQASGLVMAIMLAGLRGIDPELWKAARVDGVPLARYYLNIVIPMLKPMFVTAIVLLAVGGVKVYDLIVAMTGGGPGIATEVPAKFVMEYLFRRANIGLATAAASVMFVTVIAVIGPWIYVEHFRREKGRKPV
jgi:glucose/mannose transport system permease protein